MTGNKTILSAVAFTLFGAWGCTKNADNANNTPTPSSAAQHPAGFAPAGKPKRVLHYTSDNQENPYLVEYLAYDNLGNLVHDSMVSTTAPYSYLQEVITYAWQDGLLIKENQYSNINKPDSAHAWENNFKVYTAKDYSYNTKKQLQQILWSNQGIPAFKYTFSYNDFDSLQTKYIIENSPPSFDLTDTTWRIEYAYDTDNRLYSEYQYQQYYGGGFVQQMHYIYLYPNNSKLPSREYYEKQSFSDPTTLMMENYYYYNGAVMVEVKDPTDTYDVESWDYNSEMLISHNYYINFVKYHSEVYEY